MKFKATFARLFNTRSIGGVVNHALAVNSMFRRRLSEKIYKQQGAATFAEEYQTVRFDVGRHTGKSHLIAQRATPNDAVVVMNEFEREYLRGLGCRSPIYNLQALAKAVPANPSLPLPKVIWVSSMDRNNPELERVIYDTFAANPDQTFIFLG